MAAHNETGERCTIRQAFTLASIVVGLTVPATAADARPGCDTTKCKQRVAEKHWRHLQWKLPPATKAMLLRLRMCESTGRYHIAGHHFGAYQYSIGRGSAAERAGFRVRPDRASPAEQDVRTARFYPAHRGEWACRA